MRHYEERQRRGRRTTGVCLAVFALAGLALVYVATSATAASTAKPAGSPTARPLSPASEATPLVVVIPIYNNAGLTAVRTVLRPHIRSGDILALVSGNNNKAVDVRWLSRSAENLKRDFPANPIMAMTSGLTNVRTAAEQLTFPFEGMIYVYEPNFPNEPEFTWDFAMTQRNFQRASQTIRAHGLRSVGKPTGRPVLQPTLQKYNWDYGVLAQGVDEMIIQTQTYCKQGREAFGRAIGKLRSQYESAGVTQRWFAQVTVDPNAPNGVPVPQAYQCAEVAKSKGLEGIIMWWSPQYASAAVEFLQLLGR